MSERDASVSRWIRRTRLGVGWRVIDLAIGVIFALVFQSANTEALLARVILVWGVWLFFRLVVGPSKLEVGALTTLSCYGSAAFLLAHFGDLVYQPWPSMMIILSSTQDALFAVCLTYGMSMLILPHWARDLVSDASDSAKSRDGHDLDPFMYLLSLGFLIIVGIIDWAQLILSIGISAVMHAERRTYASSLILSSQHNIQFLAMACSFVVAVYTTGSRASRLATILVALFCWLPFLLVGSRKEFVILLLGILFTLSNRLTKRVRLCIGLVLVGFFLAPSLISPGRGLELSLQEFALPQYMQFTIRMGSVPFDLAGTFFQRAWLMLPSFLRPVHAIDFGQAFAALNQTSVGVGASPFGEAELVNWLGSPAITLILLWFGSIFVALQIGRVFPRSGGLSLALIYFYGRGDFWTQAFFIVALAISVTFFSVSAARVAVSNHADDDFSRRRSH